MGIVHDKQRKGRGAASNKAARFLRHEVEAIDDGWDQDDDLPPLRTEVRHERPRTIISRNKSPDIGFDRSVNAYRGCEHGCIYCFARPSHAYLDLSPGLDFETKLTAKPGAAHVLRKELSKRGYVSKTLAMGTNTDPYQPIEKDLRITRQLIEVLNEFNHPLSIVTKGVLIERDIDLLAKMASKTLVNVGISITTLDPATSRAMEPRVPAPKRRLATIRRLADAGIPVRAMISPVVPALTDHELEAICEAVAEAGASHATSIVLRLPGEIAPLFKDWLQEHYPDRANRVLKRVRELHGGKDYDAQWGKRMKGEGKWAQLTHARFKLAKERNGLDADLPKLRTDLFRVPPQKGDQLELF